MLFLRNGIVLGKQNRMSLINNTFQAKRRPTKRAPDAGDSAHIPSSFLRLSFFLVGRLRRPRPSAGNAIRWLAGHFSNQ